MAGRLADEQAHVRLHAYGVGRGVDKEELLRIISARDAATAEDRCARGVRVCRAPAAWQCPADVSVSAVPVAPSYVCRGMEQSAVQPNACLLLPPVLLPQVSGADGA